MEAINSCRFTGRLKIFTTSLVGEDKLLLGKGILYLPDPKNKAIGQDINIIAWDTLATRLVELPIGTWITVLSSYMPSTFRGQIQDTFNITSLIKHE